MSLESVAAPLAGAVLGGLTGGDSSGGTQTTKPYLPKRYEEEYDALLEKALKLSDTPFAPRDTMRVAYTYPTNAFEGLFQNPELGELQRRSDQKYFESLVQPQTQEPAAPQEDPQAMADLEARMIARQHLSAPNDLGYHTTQTLRNKQMLEAGLYDDKSLADIGRYVGEANKYGGTLSGAAQDMVRRTKPELLDAYGAANQAMLQAAMARKAGA